MLSLTNILTILAILCIGVPYGSQTFFATVARPALERTDEAALAQVMGRIHEVAMVRMMFYGLPGAFITFALIFLTGLGSLASWLAIVAFLMLCADLALSFVYGWPVNRKLIAAARSGATPPDTRALQRTWDRGNIFRAVAMALAIGCLVGVALLKTLANPLFCSAKYRIGVPPACWAAPAAAASPPCH